jgi:hypothetical protein
MTKPKRFQFGQLVSMQVDEWPHLSNRNCLCVDRETTELIKTATRRRGPPWQRIDYDLLIAKTYGTAHKLPSGLRYIVRSPGTGDATPKIGEEVIAHYDGRLLDATRNFSLSHRTHQAKLPERRPETGPWQERRGGCGKSSEHDHYFPSRADRFTGLFLESRMSFLVSDVD